MDLCGCQVEGTMMHFLILSSHNSGVAEIPDPTHSEKDQELKSQVPVRIQIQFYQNPYSALVFSLSHTGSRISDTVDS